MSESIVDEVVAHRTGTGAVPRATMNETVSEHGGPAREEHAAGVEQETRPDAHKGGRVLKATTQALLDKLEAGDTEDPDDVGLVDDTASETSEAGGTEGETVVEEKPVTDEWQTKAARLEEHNRRLLAENESLRKAPKMTKSERDAALAEAEQAYVDEGPVVAIRKFLSTVIGAAHDSKDVDAELSGLYADLTARELNVPLEASHQALREIARARLALARDKREKSEVAAATKAPDQSDESAQVAQAATFIDNLLTTKRESGKSFADDHPMLMNLAEHFDGLKPHELLARVIKRDIQVGTLDPSLGNDALVKEAAQRIEAHYNALADKVTKAKPQPKTVTDTAKAGDSKPATAGKTSTDQRQSTGAQKLTNASASVAPATSPKTKKPTTAPEEKPKFKNDKERREWALRHLG